MEDENSECRFHANRANVKTKFDYQLDQQTFKLMMMIETNSSCVDFYLTNFDKRLRRVWRDAATNLLETGPETLLRIKTKLRVFLRCGVVCVCV